MAQLVEALVSYYLKQQRAWPALPLGRRGGWDEERAYLTYARELLSVALLHRGPHVLQARLVLQKARALYSAGMAHCYRVSLLCVEDLGHVRSGRALGGPMRALCEGEDWAPTEHEFDTCVYYTEELLNASDYE
jgi:hypothetical protein